MRRCHDRSTSAKLFGTFVCAGRSPLSMKRALRRLALYGLTLTTPEVDGFSFGDVFRKTPMLQRTPLIIWTPKKLCRNEAERLQSLGQPGVLKDNSNGVAPMRQALQDLLSTGSTGERTSTRNATTRATVGFPARVAR